ncbi:MAG: hypothetical protein AAGE94_17620, partial [Acidobacteriota bacterium]
MTGDVDRPRVAGLQVAPVANWPMPKPSGARSRCASSALGAAVPDPKSMCAIGAFTAKRSPRIDAQPAPPTPQAMMLLSV